MKSFLDRLAEGLIVGDGGTGTMVLRAHPELDCIEYASIDHPETVTDVHLAFVEAGARILSTNTFGANRYKLAARNLEDRVREINSKSVKLAREAREISGKEVWVAGSIGPTGLHLDPLHRDNEARQKLLEAFREQAAALDERGVDLFVLETFRSLYECLVAIEAVRDISSQPIVASLTFPDEWSPSMGRVHVQLLGGLAATGVAAIGLNCSMGPARMLDILESVAPLDSMPPFIVQPNVGVPISKDGRVAYPNASPEYFAKFARTAIRIGARILGGCCGTMPAHVAAITAVVEEHEANAAGASETPARASAKAGAAVSVERGAGAGRDAMAPGDVAGSRAVVETPVHVGARAAGTAASRLAAAGVEGMETPVAASAAEVGDRFADKIAAGDFVTVVQLDPPKGTNMELCLSAVDRFLKSGKVDAVDVNSNPMARLHMDSLWASHMIEGRGMETIPHITPRDASLMGLEGALLGAWRVGIRNVLVVTGDPSQLGNHPGTHDVYQTDGVGLVEVVRELNDGFDWVGNKVGDPPSFCIGVAVNPNAEDLDLEVERFKKKVDNGAHFAMTQVFFEWGCWERFLDRFGGQLPIPALVAIWPLTSYRLAVRLHNEVPGIVVPQSVQDDLEAAGKGARGVGFDLARRLCSETPGRGQGVYVIAPFKNPSAALDVI